MTGFPHATAQDAEVSAHTASQVHARDVLMIDCATWMVEMRLCLSYADAANGR